MVACRNSAGAVDGERPGGGDLVAARPAAGWQTRPPRVPTSATATWTGCRLSRGPNASTSTPDAGRAEDEQQRGQRREREVGGLDHRSDPSEVDSWWRATAGSIRFSSGCG